MSAGDLERVDVAVVRTRLDPADADPRRVAVLAVAGRRDALGLASDRGEHAGPVAGRDEEERVLDLVGAGDAQPVRVLGGLRNAADALAGDDAELAKKAHDAIGELVAHGAELEDHA